MVFLISSSILIVVIFKPPPSSTISPDSSGLGNDDALQDTQIEMIETNSFNKNDKNVVDGVSSYLDADDLIDQQDDNSILSSWSTGNFMNQNQKQRYWKLPQFEGME